MNNQERQALIAFAEDVVERGEELGYSARERQVFSIALASLKSEPEVYEAEINGVMSSVTKSHYDDCKKYGVKTRVLYTAPPASAIALPDEIVVWVREEDGDSR